LHGDLWRGNLLVDERGLPCVIDPAVYYGHREAELAFTQLFGGFDNRFFDAYVEAYPLQPGFDKRLNVYNLYPLLVHANLFGGSYLRQAERIIAGW
jgi:fructosamine-3-kinase